MTFQKSRDTIVCFPHVSTLLSWALDQNSRAGTPLTQYVLVCSAIEELPLQRRSPSEAFM